MSYCYYYLNSYVAEGQGNTVGLIVIVYSDQYNNKDQVKPENTAKL